MLRNRVLRDFSHDEIEKIYQILNQVNCFDTTHIFSKTTLLSTKQLFCLNYIF